MIRFAKTDDLESIVAIYNQAVVHKNATADLQPVEVQQRIRWFNEHSPESYPVYVKEIDGKVAGWCSLSPYRHGRLALEKTVEIVCYIDYTHHSRGIGSELIQHALHDCIRLKKRIVFAILLEKNIRSIKLLEKFGFERWGYLPEVAEFDSKLCGHIYMGKKIVV